MKISLFVLRVKCSKTVWITGVLGQVLVNSYWLLMISTASRIQISKRYKKFKCLHPVLKTIIILVAGTSCHTLSRFIFFNNDNNATSCVITSVMEGVGWEAPPQAWWLGGWEEQQGRDWELFCIYQQEAS